MNNYLNSLHKYFYIDNEVELQSSDLKLSYKNKDDLLSAISEQRGCINNWKSLLSDLKGIPHDKISDFTKSGFLHSYNALFSYTDKENKEIGINFSISFPHKIYGFYYAKFINASEYDRYEVYDSYKPFELDVLIKRNEIINFIKKYFPSFEEFDNDFADKKIKLIVIEDMIYKDIELWQILFTNNKIGII